MGLICLLTTLCCHLTQKVYYFWGYSESWHSEVFYGKTKKNHPVQLPRLYLLSFSLGVPPSWRKTSLLSSKENKQTMSYSLLCLLVMRKGKRSLKAGIGWGFWGGKTLLNKTKPHLYEAHCDSSVFTLPKELLASSLTNFIKKCDMLDL